MINYHPDFSRKDQAEWSGPMSKLEAHLNDLLTYIQRSGDIYAYVPKALNPHSFQIHAPVNRFCLVEVVNIRNIPLAHVTFRWDAQELVWETPDYEKVVLQVIHGAAVAMDDYVTCKEIFNKQKEGTV